MKETTAKLIRAGKYWAPESGLKEGLRECDAVLRHFRHDWRSMNDRASVLHSAAENAANVQAKDERKFFIAKFFWKLRGWWLLEFALYWSDRAWKARKLASESDITSEMCDDRQSILLAASKLLWHWHRLDEVQDLVRLGMRVNEEKILHWTLLLELRQLDFMIRRNYSRRVVEMSLKHLIDQAALAVGDLPEDAEIETRVEHFRQYALVYRHIAARCRDVGWTDSAKKYAEKALRLGYESRAFDQIAKISL